jgi:hypothetical protein
VFLQRSRPVRTVERIQRPLACLHERYIRGHRLGGWQRDAALREPDTRIRQGDKSTGVVSIAPFLVRASFPW